MKQQDKVFMVVGSAAVLIAAGFTGVRLFSKTDADLSGNNPTSISTNGVTPNDSTTDSDTSILETTQTATTTDSNKTNTASSFKDGTYTANISYYVPKGSNSLTAKVTISGNVITDINVDHDYKDHESGRFVDSFDSALDSVVVGKNIDGLSLVRIGGATLTTEAFDDALTTIRSDSKA